MSFKYFTLASVDLGAGLPPPTYEIAVGLGHGRGEYDWSGPVVGPSCAGHEEWDGVIDDLIESLERVRKAGHKRLSRSRGGGPWPRARGLRR